MKSIIRKDEAAVSPVIATILMVAITVVLAAVLYVMVYGCQYHPVRRRNELDAVDYDDSDWPDIVSD